MHPKTAILNLTGPRIMTDPSSKPLHDDIISARPDTRADGNVGMHGQFDVPGDKSISHRSLIFGGLAIGTTRVTGLLEGDDVMATCRAMQDLGVDITRADDGSWVITGVGSSGLISPQSPLDLGNSGTGVRLLMGVVAGQPITATFCGDASLSKRPMARVTDPLAEMGAGVTSREGGRLPCTITGSPTPLAADYDSVVASAQIKSAILLAGLNARGTTIITEPHASRDHTESMLRHFGATVTQHIGDDGTHTVKLTGEAILRAADIIVPRDPSSAAFPMVAALITPGSDLLIPGIGMNPLRTGLITTLLDMGGDITISNERVEGGETVADLRVRHSQLHGIDVPSSRAASMIDEYPILAIAATVASGVTRMTGVAELRVKETDRIAVVADGITAAGGDVSYDEDSMTVRGGEIAGGISVDSQHDHRIAMSFLILGMISTAPITVTGCATINTSFPGFAALMNDCGAAFHDADIPV
ncbi:3-phosphoshikimate 1-carboxyvinyltransferase [Alphaproteobacteria bacterium]|jgi:3-phosphoshikimate 1-carboxyvinyltransferase|nr:3-phosphoshikimate 1-carboxyvinyltransferase [Alphaproteobacteria bacterium]